MKDEVKPMEELERLFNERRRWITNKECQEHDIKTLEGQLAVKEEQLIGANENLEKLEEAIRNWSKKI